MWNVAIWAGLKSNVMIRRLAGVNGSGEGMSSYRAIDWIQGGRVRSSTWLFRSANTRRTEEQGQLMEFKGIIWTVINY